MRREDFTQWGVSHGHDHDWALARIDSLSFAQFLEDMLPHTYLPTTNQLTEFIMSGPGEIWAQQGELYNYLFSLNFPHRDWKPVVLAPALSENEFAELVKYSQDAFSKKDMLDSCSIFRRYALYDSPFLKLVHQKVTPYVEKVLNKKLKKTYSYLSYYGEQGICPPHRDRSECQWTLDLCIAQDKPWPLFVEDKSFLLKPNEGLIYSGTDQLHWRNQIHSQGHCHLVFFHFKEE